MRVNASRTGAIAPNLCVRAWTTFLVTRSAPWLFVVVVVVIVVVQGIDDEYHAKHDKQYCWRATRLVMAHHSSWFDPNTTKDVAKEGAAKLALLDRVAHTLAAQAKLQAAAEASSGGMDDTAY